MKVKITINCDNAAFDDAPATELARILHELEQEILDGTDSKPLYDINGNKVGEFIIGK